MAGFIKNDNATVDLLSHEQFLRDWNVSTRIHTLMHTKVSVPECLCGFLYDNLKFNLSKRNEGTTTWK